MAATDLAAVASLEAIIAYARAGKVKAKALVLTEKRFRDGGGGGGPVEHVEADVAVPIRFWGNFIEKGLWKRFVWQSGVFEARGFDGPDQLQITLTGVQFAARDLDVLDPSRSQASTTRAVSAAGKRGVPPKDWWDDLLIEMFRRLWEGNWTPATKAEIVEAMHNWLAANPGPDPHNPREAGDTVLKERAKKLFDGLKLGRK